jgi:hypothetical protein
VVAVAYVFIFIYAAPRLTSAAIDGAREEARARREAEAEAESEAPSPAEPEDGA